MNTNVDRVHRWGLKLFLVCQDFIKVCTALADDQRFFLRSARKAGPWSSFLYSDSEGVKVKTVQYANGVTGRGFLLTKISTRNIFRLFTGCNKNGSFRLCWRCKPYSLTRLTNIFRNSSIDPLVTANCRMKKIIDDQCRNHCIFLATHPIQPD